MPLAPTVFAPIYTARAMDGMRFSKDIILLYDIFCRGFKKSTHMPIFYTTYTICLFLVCVFPRYIGRVLVFTPLFVLFLYYHLLCLIINNNYDNYSNNSNNNNNNNNCYYYSYYTSYVICMFVFGIRCLFCHCDTRSLTHSLNRRAPFLCELYSCVNFAQCIFTCGTCVRRLFTCLPRCYALC